MKIKVQTYGTVNHFKRVSTSEVPRRIKNCEERRTLWKDDEKKGVWSNMCESKI